MGGPETGWTVLTGPLTGSVQVWDFRRGRCLRDYRFEAAAGVVHSDAGFLVSNRHGELLVFGEDLPEKPRIVEGTGLAGAHLAIWPHDSAWQARSQEGDSRVALRAARRSRAKSVS